MAIMFSCPECERDLKLKEELAGRKIKCPGCGASILVPTVEEEEEDGIAAGPPMKRPKSEDRVAAGPARKKRPSAAVEEDEDDEAPRKKKKKPKSNLPLILGAIGAGAFLLLLCGGIVAFLVLNRKPDAQAKNQDTRKVESRKEEVQAPKASEKVQPKGGLVRGMDIQEVKNNMKQIGLAYHNYHDTFKRGPSKWQDLSPYYEKVPALDKMLSDGSVVFIYNVAIRDMLDGTSNTLIAYEKDADTKGLRVVLYGDGSVDVLPEAEFQAKTKAHPRK